jgi:hypothetical protein
MAEKNERRRKEKTTMMGCGPEPTQPNPLQRLLIPFASFGHPRATNPLIAEESEKDDKTRKRETSTISNVPAQRPQMPSGFFYFFRFFRLSKTS